MNVVTIPVAKHSGAFKKAIRFGVLHSAECPLRPGYAVSLTEWCKNSSVVSSWSRFVDPTTVVVQGPDNRVRWHATIVNSESIGWEQAGYARFSREEWLTEYGRLQLELLAQDMAPYVKEYGWELRFLTADEVRAARRGERAGGLVTHEVITEVSGTRNRTDPGDHYPYDLLLARIGELIADPMAPVQPQFSVPAATPANAGQTLHLSAAATRWAVYPLNRAPVVGNQIGYLAPKRYNGLSYEILRWAQPNVAVIKTGSFGEVQIYTKDSAATITGGTAAPAASKAQTLHLPASVDRWGIYRMGVTPVKRNIAGYLAPKRYGGLTYEILGWSQPGVVAIIQTSTYGRVQIYVADGTGAVIK